MFPGPNKPKESVCWDMKKTVWSALSALTASRLEMTALMFLSLEPWAMALTFTPALARDEKSLPATPMRPGMDSPTTARMERLSSISMEEIWCRDISLLNSFSRVFFAF